MSFELTQRIKLLNPYANIDELYGPYSSRDAALSQIIPMVREKGRTVGVIDGNSVVEYWFESGVTDNDFVVKGPNSGGDHNQLTNKQGGNEETDEFFHLDGETYNNIKTNVGVWDFNIVLKIIDLTE